LNVLGLLLTTQEALKYFNPAGGSIVNLSSLVSTITPPNASVYSATKGAVDAVTGSLARELGARKIRVNAVRPGLVETEGTNTAGFTTGDFHDQFVAQTSLGRIGQPQDIATAVTFLASSDSSWITGETLLVAGGYH
jgi:3-oxoacyl-[acyl-carrier protein] reductase